MFNRLKEMDGVKMYFDYEVRDLKRRDDGTWRVKVKDRDTGEKRKVNQVRIYCAGGGSLRLLEKSDIPEERGFGGFP